MFDVFNDPAGALLLVAAVVLVLAVDVITKRWASGPVKNGVLAVLAVVLGIVWEAIDAGFAQYDWGAALNRALDTLLLALVAFLGLSGFKVSGADGLVQRLLPGGIGKNTPPDALTEVQVAGPVDVDSIAREVARRTVVQPATARMDLDGLADAVARRMGGDGPATVAVPAEVQQRLSVAEIAARVEGDTRVDRPHWPVPRPDDNH